MENYTRTAVLDQILEDSGGAKPVFEGTTEMTTDDLINGLVEGGVIVEDGASYSVESNSSEWDVRVGDIGVSQALNNIISGQSVDWVDGNPETGEGVWVNGESAFAFSEKYVDYCHPMYVDMNNQLNFGRGDINELYSRHGQKEDGE